MKIVDTGMVITSAVMFAIAWSSGCSTIGPAQSEKAAYEITPAITQPDITIEIYPDDRRLNGPYVGDGRLNGPYVLDKWENCWPRIQYRNNTTQSFDKLLLGTMWSVGQQRQQIVDWMPTCITNNTGTLWMPPFHWTLVSSALRGEAAGTGTVSVALYEAVMKTNASTATAYGRQVSDVLVIPLSIANSDPFGL